VPDRNLGGWVYSQAQPNAGLSNGGVWLWDDTASFSWEIPYFVNYWGLQLAPRAERDLRDFEWPSGVHVKATKPLMNYEIRYSDPDECELALTFEAIMPPNGHPAGVRPFLNAVHLDQPGRVTGELVLRGETIPVDCFALRDRSWGPRPRGRPKRMSRSATDAETGTSGVGYSYGTASPTEAFLVFTVPTSVDDKVVCGYLLRDGEYAHIVSGAREVRVDPDYGWPVSIEIEAVDDRRRTFHALGTAHSRHWRAGHGGDSFMSWEWDGAAGVGEDQTYFSKQVWVTRRDAARNLG
jgi:hypothetical protein